MKALVTGGGGFLGRAIVRCLLERKARVASFSRGNYPHLREKGVATIRGDLTDFEALSKAAVGCDIVFHTASKTPPWGTRDEYYQTNVVGTENVIRVCREHEITRLVYTSTPSVVHGGGDLTGVDESLPYPDHFENHYSETKAMAEQMVLGANGEGLATVALRPHLIWGPGDPNLVPRLVLRAGQGRLFRVKGGPYMIDTVYIDNAADAHLSAADRLFPGSPIAGRPFFIAQDEPMDSGDLIDRIIGAAGYPPVNRSISPKSLYAIGALVETVYKWFRVKKEPPMTRFLANQLSTSHWFDLSAARRDLGYSPRISIEEGIDLLHRHFLDGASFPPRFS